MNKNYINKIVSNCNHIDTAFQLENINIDITKKYMYIDFPVDPKIGFFAKYMHTLYLLNLCEKFNYIPIVSWKNDRLYNDVKNRGGGA